MRSVSKYSKYSKYLKWLILIIIVILLGMLVLTTKNNLTSLVPSSSNFSTIENLQASMSRFGAVDHSGQSKFFIKFSYTTPSTITPATTYYPIFYLLDYYVNKRATPLVGIPDPNIYKLHPGVTELLAQYYLTQSYAPVIRRSSNSDEHDQFYTKLGSNYNTPSSMVSSTNVSGSINENSGGSENNKIYLLDITKFNNSNIQSGDKFWFGIALQGTLTRAWDTNNLLPNVYGNFKYVQITAADPVDTVSMNIITQGGLLGGVPSQIDFNFS